MTIIRAVAAVMPQPRAWELVMASGAGAVGVLVAIIVILLVGAIAGWLAGKIMAGRGFGFWANAGLGVLGAIVGSFVFAVLGIYAFGLVATIIKATVGAVIVLAIANWWRRRRAA
jgi:uncharacterized membrane protein YeaQ/YmgE (transglycosylase-associated protein family)